MTMTPNRYVYFYRPRQVILATGSPRKNTLHLVRLAPNQRKQLGLMVLAALVIGLGLTQFFHVRIGALQAKVDQLQTSYTVLADKNLVAADDQVASKTQIVELAKRKLKLFEPDQRQGCRL
jgi:uncharacterized protein HemX